MATAFTILGVIAAVVLIFATGALAMLLYVSAAFRAAFRL